MRLRVKRLYSLQYLKYIFLGVGVMLIITGLIDNQKQRDYETNYQSQFDKIYIKGDNADKLNNYKELYNLKYAYYQSLITKFSSIQKWMLVLLVSSILVLVFGVERLPLIGITIPDNLIYMVIFFGGIYFWVNFGLTFNTLIDERLSLISYLDKIETFNGGAITYYNNPKHLLLDNSIMDNWFSHYFKIFAKDSSNKLAFEILGLYGIYALVLGNYVANIVISAIEFTNRKALGPYLQAVLIVFAVAMIAASTFAFLDDNKRYAIIWMGAIWLFAAIVMLYWDKNGTRLYKMHRNKKTKVNAMEE